MADLAKYRYGTKVYYGDPELEYMVTWTGRNGNGWVYDIRNGYGPNAVFHTWVDESELSEYTLKERVKRLEERLGLG